MTLVVLETDTGLPIAIRPDAVTAVVPAPKSLGREAECCDVHVALSQVFRVKGPLLTVVRAIERRG